MSTDPFSEYKIETPASALTTDPSVTLTDPQKLLVASVLDLFAGHPTKRKLTLWRDDASFHDPLTNATTRPQYEAQWYGLRAAFSSISRLSLNITSSANPIALDLKTRYTVKGINSDQTVSSKVLIHTVGDGNDMRIAKVEDRWDGEIKEGPVRHALRELNAKVVPGMVSVPKSVEEEEGQSQK